jgi:hypothetical protein
MRGASVLVPLVAVACSGPPSGGDDATTPDAELSPDVLVCTPRVERDVPMFFRGTDYVPAVSVEGSVTQGGHTWAIQSATLDMVHLRDPGLADRCVIDYRVIAFLERDNPTCILALEFWNSGNERNLYQFAFDTRGCPGVMSADETSWESPTTVAPLWPTLTGSLLAEDEYRRCAPATVAFPDVRLLVPTPYETSVSLAGLRVQGPFASRADSDFTGTCDVPVEAQCSSGQASPEGVCEPY